MTVGLFGAFTFRAVQSLTNPSSALATFISFFVQALGTSAQVFRLLDLPKKSSICKTRGCCRASRNLLNSMTPVSCTTTAKLPLSEISSEDSSRAVVAIVGSSGAGKTTLVNLLPRFYAATSGSVRIDGHDVREVTLRSLREQMAIVTQETILFKRHDLEQPVLRPAQYCRKKK